MKARHIPYSLKEAVIEEIERLEKEGILRPVYHILIGPAQFWLSLEQMEEYACAAILKVHLTLY